jgi:ubiquinone/menaquinone biosynthesis C-methylase UbiE
LNPGADNKYVLTGDFHSLSFADSSVDAIYTNCLDHAFDIDKIAREVNRVLKPEGLFLVDIVYGFQEGYTVGNHDTMHWPTAKGFAELLAAKGGLQLTGFRDLKDVGSASWCQAQLTKS